jgi:hypothetical protein
MLRMNLAEEVIMQTQALTMIVQQLKEVRAGIMVMRNDMQQRAHKQDLRMDRIEGWVKDFDERIAGIEEKMNEVLCEENRGQQARADAVPDRDGQ